MRIDWQEKVRAGARAHGRKKNADGARGKKDERRKTCETKKKRGKEAREKKSGSRGRMEKGRQPQLFFHLFLSYPLRRYYHRHAFLDEKFRIS